MNAGPDHSDETALRVAYLIAGYIRKTLTVAEHDELDAWVEASDENMKLFEDLTDEAHIDANLAWMDQIQTEKALAETTAKLTFQSPRNKTATQKTRRWWPYMAAASLVVAVAAYFLLLPDDHSGKPPTYPSLGTSSFEPLPGGNKATLTLSDGTHIDLTQVHNGLIQGEQGAAIQKTGDSALAYTSQSSTTIHGYNTLTTPTGGQYALTLSDGTKVWLNAQSSLRFPVQFSGSQRIVELQGEGFFEVSKNKEKPFIVQLLGDNQVQVLGTRFNAMSYGDEASQQITLEEGRVQVASKGDQKELKPGEQAVIANATISIQKDADLEAIKGWKEGTFVFHDAEINDIMRQIKRWYDVTIVYQNPTSEHFNATISRTEPLSKLLKLLELTGKIHFKLENKTIYVLP